MASVECFGDHLLNLEVLFNRKPQPLGGGYGWMP